jgi:hypothetical protein
VNVNVFCHLVIPRTSKRFGSFGDSFLLITLRRRVRTLKVSDIERFISFGCGCVSLLLVDSGSRNDALLEWGYVVVFPGAYTF